MATRKATKKRNTATRKKVSKTRKKKKSPSSRVASPKQTVRRSKDAGGQKRKGKDPASSRKKGKRNSRVKSKDKSAKRKPTRAKTGEPRGFKLSIRRVKQKGLETLRKQQKKREIKRLTKKYGKSKRIPKKEVPDTPHIIRPKKPKKLKASSRAIRGLIARIRTRGQRSGPGKEIYVSASTEFINAAGEKTKRSLKKAREAIPEFVEKIQRRYSGRLSLISVSVKFLI